MKFEFQILAIIILGIISCKNEDKTETKSNSISEVKVVTIDTFQGISLTGQPLTRTQVDEERDLLQIKNYRKALRFYEKDSTDTDNIVWLGRRMAYLGDYKKAIAIYSEGIKIHDSSPRLYRHRGHRYITLRKFDEAINDFEKASSLIEGKEDIIEQDGIPNKLNKPVSTLHTNIYYHLGLAHYLKNDLEKAEDAFKKCLDASKNDDMQVATRHWLYMILRKQNKNAEANALLKPIEAEMDIIENDAYHQLLLFYKGLKSEDELTNPDGAGSSEAIKYGVANWHLYNGNLDKAKLLMQSLVDNGNWAGFGFIAAEVDLKRLD